MPSPLPRRSPCLFATTLALTLCACTSASQPASSTTASGVRAAPGPRDTTTFPGPRGAGLDTLALRGYWDRPSDHPLAAVVQVPRDSVVAFALYTHDAGTLKLTAQLTPLHPDEAQAVTLELDTGAGWVEVARAPVEYPGWSAHFRLDDWDDARDVAYRVRHGPRAAFVGRIRRDPRARDTIVVASLSCNSNKDRGDRAAIVRNLLHHDPDLLFFAGDQSYDHQQHTAAWLLWGRQFREVIRDRPVVTIPDDHDIGQGNFWGEGGVAAARPEGDDGGYYYPAAYVRMVERGQTAHLPDPPDPAPVAQGIGVYFTRLRVGGVDFAILEDRKFKTGPLGTIPQLGPRPDHVNDPSYDPASINSPGLELLGARQEAFLAAWAEDWAGAEVKAALSQTAFAGAVHLHGTRDNRLLADLDCNGWPQAGRDRALRLLRRARATHLCGDQHLAVAMQHGIDAFRDGPYAFTNPAIVNSYYGRWWWPADERPGGGAPVPGPLPWTGDYRDGLGNRLTMLAYANPEPGDAPDLERHQRDPSVNLGDGYGLIRFDKRRRAVTFECWPHFADVRRADARQYPGWPITFPVDANDGRPARAHLPTLTFAGVANAVVQVVDEANGEVLYTRRAQGADFRPPVFAAGGTYTVRAGRDRPDAWTRTGVRPAAGADATLAVELR